MKPCVSTSRNGGRPRVREADELRARDEHPRRLVRLRIEPRGGAVGAARADVAGRHLPRRQRPASRLVPELAARRPRHARPPAVPAGPDARLRRRRRRQEDVEVARQHDRAAGHHQAERRRHPAPVGRDERLHAGHPRSARRSSRASSRRTARSATRCATCSPTCTTSIRRPTWCRRRSSRRSTATSSRATPTSAQRILQRLRGVRLRHDLPGAERVRDGRPERVLHRHLEGRPLHVRAALAASGARRRRRCT